MALTPEEQLELEEIRTQREALELEQASISEEIAKFEEGQAAKTIPKIPTPVPMGKEQEGFLTRLGKGAMDIVEPVAKVEDILS